MTNSVSFLYIRTCHLSVCLSVYLSQSYQFPKFGPSDDDGDDDADADDDDDVDVYDDDVTIGAALHP